MAEQYLTITPAGSLLTEQCVAAGHQHTGPDVPLGSQCPTHHAAWVWCAGCSGIWCPGVGGRKNGHYGTIVTAQTLPAEPLADELNRTDDAGLVGPYA